MAEEAAGEWDAVVQEWLTDPGYCYAAAMASRADCALYAAAPAEGGWDWMYREDHEEQILQDDGETTVPTLINEASTLLTTLEKGRSRLGLWIGGTKYNVVQWDADFQSGEHTFTWALGCRPKAGAHIVATASTVVVGLYSEESGQTAGAAKTGVCAFAEYLAASGF